MNVKSCLKVGNALLYRTISLKLEEGGETIYYYRGRAARARLRGSGCASSLAYTHRSVCTLTLARGASPG
jgi:hypothetical protein